MSDGAVKKMFRDRPEILSFNEEREVNQESCTSNNKHGMADGVKRLAKINNVSILGASESIRKSLINLALVL